MSGNWRRHPPPLISHRKYMGKILTINVPYTLLTKRGGMAAPTSRLLMTSNFFFGALYHVMVHTSPEL